MLFRSIPQDDADLDALLTTLTACPRDQLTTWLGQHRHQLTLALLQKLKASYATFAFIIAQPQLAEQMTGYALTLAAELPQEPLALPLAQWSRGLWAMLHNPPEAIDYFRLALPAYEAAGDALSVARLATNLVGVLADCGRFTEGEAEYQRAYPIVATYAASDPLYLLALEQNYGWLLHNQGRYQAALTVHDRALTLATQAQDQQRANQIRVNRAFALGMLGQFNTLEEEYRQNQAVAQTQGQALTVARIAMNLGELYTVLGRPAAALRQFQQAQQTFVRLANAMEVSTVQMLQAQLFERIGSLTAAIEHYALALQTMKPLAIQPQMGALFVNYAVALRRAGEYKRARAALDQAETVWQPLHNEAWLLAILLERITLALERQDEAQAAQLLQHIGAEQAVFNPRIQAELAWTQAEIRRQTLVAADDGTAQVAYQAAYRFGCEQGDRWLQRKALLGLGKLLRHHHPADAQHYLALAVALDQEIRQTLTVEELKAGYQAQSDDLFTELITLALAQAQPQQALAYAWAAKSDAFLELAQRLTLEQQQSSAERAELTAVRQQLATLRWQAARQEADMPDALRERTNPAITQLEQRLLTLRQQRNAQYLAGQAHLEQTPTTVLPKLTADLLLEYYRGDDQIIGFCANRAGQCIAIPLVDVESIATLTAQLQLHFQYVVTQPAPEPERLQRWQAEILPLLAQGYDRLVRPLLDRAAQEWGIVPQHVLLAACAPFTLLPFAALWDGVRYWMASCQIEFILSGALVALPRLIPAHYSPALIIAATTASMTAVRTEAHAVAATLPHSRSFVDEPVIDYLRALTAPPQLLHIAAHTVLREDAPIFSGLHLAGEVLAVEQCYELPLAGAKLVTLSGCTTAAGLEGDAALLAFQSAFFLAGAHALLTSLWPVADTITTTWMTHFYQFLAQGSTVAQAVQQTQRHLQTIPSYNHPAYWAAFACTRR